MMAHEQDTNMDQKLYLTDDGLQFDKSILWLDAQSNGELSFLSTAGSVCERYKAQVIVSEETHALLKLSNPKLNALVCQYNRPFSIGRYSLELLPSGSVLGGASLFIDTGKEKILYAPTLSESKGFLARIVQFKKIDYLIARVGHNDPVRSLLTKRKEELSRLLSCVKASLEAGKSPVVFSPLLHTASELSVFFSEFGLKPLVHKKIFDINKIYESFGHKVGEYDLLKLSSHERKTVCLVPQSFRSKKFSFFDGKDDFFFVNDRFDTSYTHANIPTFHIPLPEMNIQLSKVIKDLKPKKTFLFGPYATRFAQQNKNLDFDIEILQPFHQSALL